MFKSKSGFTAKHGPKKLFFPKNRQEIFEGVVCVLRDALPMVSACVITPDSRLCADLRVKSMDDLLHISYGLEKFFGIEIGSDELLLNDYAEHTLAEVRLLLPFLDLTGVEEGSHIFTLELYTVQSLVEFVSGKLGL